MRKQMNYFETYEIKDLKEYLGVQIKYSQANIFDFIGED